MATYMIDGRLTRDGEIRTTQNGKNVLKFSVAWNRPKKDAHFYECAIFGERAEKLYPYMKRGKYAIITGEPDWREYNGKVYETIVVDKITFVNDAKENPEAKPYQCDGQYFDTREQVEAYKASKQSSTESFDDTDIPF